MLRWLFRLALKLALVGAVVVCAAVLYYGHDLPPLDGIHAVKRRPQVVVQDAQGRLLAVYGDLYGAAVPLYDLPPTVTRAVMAIEDRRFYAHWGVDPIGLGRALVTNLIHFRIRQGGSTITQQLAKVAFLTPERSLGRKIREALLALDIEHHFTKDEILTFYLNRVYFGSGAYGIEAASRRYFGRPARNLTLYQSAMLAGLLRAPSRDNPHANPERAEARTAVVLRAMRDAGFIDERDYRGALKSKTRILPPPELAGPRYFTDWIVDLLPNYVTLGQTDLVIRTTIDSELQEKAERGLAAALAKDGAAMGVSQGAMVAMAPDGAVKVLVGGADYKASQFNRAVQARRQPGSTFKLFVLLAALEDGYRPTDRFLDAPIAIGRWRPRNYRDRYYGEVSIAEAIALSLNSVAVRLTQRVGPRRVAAMAERLGLGPVKPDAGIALGTSETSLLDLTGAFAVLANRGFAAEPYGILEIRDRDNRVLFKRRSIRPARLVGERVLRDAHSVLNLVTTRGTARHAGLPQPAYGKTGTSQDYRDAWFVGYNSSLVAGVWFGNDDRKPMRDVTGGDLPARVWAHFMRAAIPSADLRRLDSGSDFEDGPVPTARR
ncbi:MAG: PBP1A family penicillin-binding protein [Rhodospirillaceae bacterium]|nr:PBP1A family penicillin-binding protein [Rhodospirillaceae bacterium]